MPKRVPVAACRAAFIWMALAGALAGAAPAHAAGMAGLQGFFAARLAPFLSATGAVMTSGYRSPARSAHLFAAALRRHGRAAGHWVAPPGRSMHNYGLAADLRFASREARAAAHSVAARFGLAFPMAWEPWHVEPAGARALAFAPAPPSLAAAVPWPIRQVRRGHHRWRHRHHARRHHRRH